MKTNFYILIIFLLAFSFGNAQSTTETVNVEITNTVTISNDELNVTVPTTTNENSVMLIDASEVKETIARTNSDIKLYFNRLRNVDNLGLLFPKIHKAVKA